MRIPHSYIGSFPHGLEVSVRKAPDKETMWRWAYRVHDANGLDTGGVVDTPDEAWECARRILAEIGVAEDR